MVTAGKKSEAKKKKKKILNKKGSTERLLDSYLFNKTTNIKINK